MMLRLSAWAVLLLALLGGCARGGGQLGDAGGRDAQGLDSGPDASEPSNCTPPCPAGQVCRAQQCLEACVGTGTSSCESGQRCCPDPMGGRPACVDVDTAETDCGTCGNVCAPRANICSESECFCGMGGPCGAGETCCLGRCVDLQTAVTDCGACGLNCAAGQVCEGGCVDPACSPECRDEETCESGECRCGANPACEEGRSCCGGACISTTEDRNNCGGCGVVCEDGQDCVNGGCTDDLPCEPTCSVGEACVRGNCQCGAAPSCADGARCCNGDCREVRTDVENCGRCGNACPTGWACCDGACVNTAQDRNHCGRCDRQCEESADRCTEGECACGSGPECVLPPLCILEACLFI